MSDEREPSGGGGDDGVIGPLPTEELRTKTSTHRNKALRKIYRGVTRVFRKKNQTGRFEFDPEVLCHRKKEWLESRSVQDRGLEWPQHCFEHLVIVGLPHTLDLTEVRDTILKEKPLKKSSTSDSTDHHHTPPTPSYEAELLYQFPEDKPLHMESETLVSFCFPHGVTPQIVKRTSSMSALNEVIYGQQHLVHSNQSFVFLQKGAGDDLPMFGICYLVDQMLHNPPGLVKEKEGGLDCVKHLIAAPRCYCLLSRYPFFSLHFQVLNVVLGLERLDCISDYMNAFIKLPPDSPLFNDLGLKSSSRMSSMLTPDSCAIGAFSASLTSQEVLYLDQQDECGFGEEGEFKLRQDQESNSGGTRSINVSSSDAESQTPKTRIHPRDSFSSIPGLLQSYPTSTTAQKFNKNKAPEQQVSNQHCCYCCSVVEVTSPCRDCSLLQKLESGRNIPLRGSASAPTQRTLLRLGGSPIPPRYPDHDQASRGSTTKTGVQDLTLSRSHFGVKTRILGEIKTQNSDSFTNGHHTFRECENEVEEASHCFVSCFEAQSMDDGVSFNPSFDFRTTDTPRRNYTQKGESIFASTSMPELSHFRQKSDNSLTPSRPRNLTTFVKCQSVGDLSSFPSTKATGSWSEVESSTSSCKIENLESSRRLLCQLRDLKVPQPGETVEFSPEEEGLQSIQFTRPIPLTLDASSDLAGIEQETALGLNPWTIAVLCRSLSLDNILTLLAGALLEKQIVFFCSNLGVLTSSVLSLLPMLRPFTWHSLILSVLPSQYLDLLDAPVPFAVGIQHKTPEIALRCKDLIRVNLYKNKVKSNAAQLTLPGAKTLHSKLTQWHKILQDSSSYSRRPSHVVTSKECNAVESFLSVLRGYFDDLIGDLKRHTITDVTSNDGVSLLLEESYLGAFPVKDQPFMKAFYQTQMFSSFVDTVIGNHDNDHLLEF